MSVAETLEKRAVSALIPYARNARLHDDGHVAQIAASIREWGFTMPVLIDEHDGIIAGHGRVLAARQLALDDVPVIVARGWSDDKKRAYVIADNKLALNSRWDAALLATELSELRDVFDLDMTGFTASEVEAIFAKQMPPDSFAAYDDSTVALEHQCPKCGYKF